MQSKWIFKRALRGLLPPDILDRPKKGFGIPVAKWFRGPLRGLLLETLDREKLEAQELLSWSAVDRLLRDHLAGRQDHRKELWTLFIFQRWYDAHLASRPSAPRSAAAPRPRSAV